MDVPVETMAFMCAGSLLASGSVFLLLFALLWYGRGEKITNRHTAQMEWQRKNRNTDWWLEINKTDRDKE